MKPTMKKLAAALAVVLVLAAAYGLGGRRSAAPAAVPAPPAAAESRPEPAPAPQPAEVPESGDAERREAAEPEPAPSGAPQASAPAEPEAPAAGGGEAEPSALTCTLSIRCDTILANPDLLDEAKAELVPAGGALLAETEAVFAEGESAFDVLLREARSAGLHLEYVSMPGYQSAYIEGIGNLYEFDCGPLSGWVYSVNGDFPNYGSSRYALQDGDEVLWQYTCDLGADVGGDNGAWS